MEPQLGLACNHLTADQPPLMEFPEHGQPGPQLKRAWLYQSPLHENLFFGSLLCGWESQANDCSLAFRSDKHNMVLAQVVCVCVPRLPSPSAYRVL
jgi:hypothetical protein